MALTQGSLEARRWLATAYQEGNAFEVAFSLLQDLTTRNPEDAWSWYRLGLLMYQNGYQTAAVSDLDRALKLGVPPEHGDRNRAETIRAIALVQSGSAETARPALRRLLDLPENAANLDLRLSMVAVEYESGNYEAALAQSDLALARDASNSAVHFWRARIFQAAGKPDRALAEAERSRDLAPDSPSPRNLLVRLYRTAGRAEDAAREAEWLRVREGEKQR